MQLEIFRNIGDVDKAAWEGLTRNTPFASTQWLKFCQRVLDEVQPFYSVLVDSDRYIAAAVSWLYKRPNIPDFPPFVEKILAPFFKRRPLLVCEIPVAAASGLILPADRAAARAALKVLSTALEGVAQQNRVSFVIFGHLMRDFAHDLDWPKSYEMVRLFPGTRMPVKRFTDYDAYLSALNKKKRKNIRRNHEAALLSGLSIVRRPTVDPEKAFELASHVSAKHGEELGEDVRRVLDLSSEVEAVWLVAEKEGRMVGFDLLFGDKNSWKVFITGNDYTTDYLYFLLSEEDIRFAIEHGADVLYAGTHLYNYKERLGYERLDDGFVRFRGMNGVSRWLSRLVRLRKKPPP